VSQIRRYDLKYPHRNEGIIPLEVSVESMSPVTTQHIYLTTTNTGITGKEAATIKLHHYTVFSAKGVTF
jgi:hypothetical protein